MTDNSITSQQNWMNLVAGLPREISVVKSDHAGRRLISYPGKVIYADQELISVRCLWTMAKTYRLGEFGIKPGDVLIEIYYRQHWFNIFAVFGPEGLAKGWYCNIAYPVSLQGDDLIWRDLALDLIVLPDGTSTLEDQDDYKALDLEENQRCLADQGLRTLEDWVAEARWPFAMR